MFAPRKWALWRMPLAAVALVAQPALADEVPAGLLKDKKVSSGREDVATPGFEAAADRKAADKDGRELKISAGGLLAAGNARALAGSLAARLRWRRRAACLTG